MGSGRVGAALAGRLDARGHSVAVIDMSAAAFRLLPADFSGQQVKGFGFDRGALIQAGITDAHGFAAVSNGDNSNIIAARVARETFGVEHVVARIYDPRRAEVYQHLGIPTVGTVRRTTEDVLRHLIPLEPDVVHADATGRIQIMRVLPERGWIGVGMDYLEEQLQVRIAYVTRFGRTSLVTPNMVIQETDELFLLVPIDQRMAIIHHLSRPPEEMD